MNAGSYEASFFTVSSLDESEGVAGLLAEASGNFTVNVVPWPSSLLALILPPCESTIHLTIESPRPKPVARLSLVVRDLLKNLSKMCGISSAGIPLPES